MSGLYIGAMGILSNMTKMDVVANNVANSKTNGYKKDEVSFRAFEETYMVERNFKNKENVGAYQNMVFVDDIKTNFDDGLYQVSESQLDIALTENPNDRDTSFFVVSKNDKDYLTRNGQFTLDEQRRISTYTGELLLGEDGNPIIIPEGEKYSIEKDGKIKLYETNEEIGTIQKVSVADENLVFLQKEHGSLFSVMTVEEVENRFGPIDELVNEYDQNVTYQKLFENNQTLLNIQQTGQVNILEQSEAEFQSYMLEGSNVDLADELVSVLEAQRGVQASQKVWQTMSDILDYESNRIGS